MNDTEKVIELLSSSLAANTVLDANSYVVNPALGHFRSSMIPYCARKIIFTALPKIFERLGYAVQLIDVVESDLEEIKHSDDLMPAAQSGTILHGSFQSLLGITEEAKPVIEQRIFLPAGGVYTVFFHGHIDILFVTKDTIWLIDLKTKKNFDWLDKTGVPDQHNVEQITVYTKYCKEFYPDMEVKPFVLYMLRTEENRLRIIDLFQPENWRVFPVPYDTEVFETMCDKGEYIRRCILNGVLPDRTIEKWQCTNKASTCIFYAICYESQPKNLKELAALFIKCYEEE